MEEERIAYLKELEDLEEMVRLESAKPVVNGDRLDRLYRQMEKIQDRLDGLPYVPPSIKTNGITEHYPLNC